MLPSRHALSSKLVPPLLDASGCTGVSELGQRFPYSIPNFSSSRELLTAV